MRYQATLRPDLRIVSQPALSGVVAKPLQKPENAGRSEPERWRPGSRQSAIREDPVSPGLPPGLLQMANDQRIVATVRLPRDVKSIAQQRNRPQQHLDPDVDHHSGSVTYGTPRTQAATTMIVEARPPIMSPRPGTRPMMPSKPKRIEVPGTRNQSSSTCEANRDFRRRTGHSPSENATGRFLRRQNLGLAMGWAWTVNASPGGLASALPLSRSEARI